MERELWKSLYQLACKLDNSWKQGRHLRYDAAAIVGVYLWAVLHDRPTSWACDAKNWAGVTPPDPLPSQPSVLVSVLRPGVLRLAAYLGVTDDDVEQAVAAIPRALGARVPA